MLWFLSPIRHDRGKFSARRLENFTFQLLPQKNDIEHTFKYKPYKQYAAPVGPLATVASDRPKPKPPPPVGVNYSFDRIDEPRTFSKGTRCWLLLGIFYCAPSNRKPDSCCSLRCRCHGVHFLQSAVHATHSVTDRTWTCTVKTKL